MPTRFCVKKIGKPSCIIITMATIKNKGEKIMSSKTAKSLLIIVKGIECF